MNALTRRQRIDKLNLPLPVFADNPPEKASNKKVIDSELGEYDLRFEIVFAGYGLGTPVIDRTRAVIIVPRALHPTFHEEARLQLKSFLENFLRTAQIALNDYLDKRSLPPTTAEGKLAIDMEVRLPSPDKSVAPSTSEPAVLIKPAAPDTKAL